MIFMHFKALGLFSSPEHKVLMVLYCKHGVRCQSVKILNLTTCSYKPQHGL